ncbi:uncharacterized protein DS421_19g652620 [Arachis hypogaea]|uniref:Uncharacterized protein n=1 Tax=Arachis hypogaea TaxID=3818 RepID=A0A6B9VB34_ARAHY|nr:uncharacterized protein DS421_19g652620 [Arachis hypogaea]
MTPIYNPVSSSSGHSLDPNPKTQATSASPPQQQLHQLSQDPIRANAASRSGGLNKMTCLVSTSFAFPVRISLPRPPPPIKEVQRLESSLVRFSSSETVTAVQIVTFYP